MCIRDSYRPHIEVVINQGACKGLDELVPGRLVPTNRDARSHRILLGPGSDGGQDASYYVADTTHMEVQICPLKRAICSTRTSSRDANQPMTRAAPSDRPLDGGVQSGQKVCDDTRECTQRRSSFEMRSLGPQQTSRRQSLRQWITSTHIPEITRHY